MSQALFKNPYVVSPAALQGGAVGNGTLTVDKLTHFTIDQTYTVICTAIAPFTVFKVVGDVDGSVGVAQVGQQYVEQDHKVFFTIQQGSTLFEIGDTFEFEVAQGTDLNQENLDDYDHLPQKNFSEGNPGFNSGDDNLRFATAALLSRLRIQDLLFESVGTGEDGNDISVQYVPGTTLTAASQIIQDLTYTADTAGSAGNDITIEYEDFTPGAFAFVGIQNIIYYAVVAGVAANSYTVQYTTGAPTSTPVVSVIGNAITVQIQSGVTTVAQIKTAVNGHVTASTMVEAVDTGNSTLTQTAPVSAQSLSGGVDPIGDAGNEVVTVTVDAIKVTMESGVSTATQIKAAVDAYGPAAALVNVTISGTGSNAQTAPEGPTNLENGEDTAGAPGAEVVTVVGNAIKVKFQSGNSTATQIKAAVDATPAAVALVSVTIPGTGSTMQTSPVAKTWLGGGIAADTYAHNKNELSAAAAFHEGNGNIAGNSAVIHGTAYVGNNAKFRRITSLNDLDALTNGSGTQVSNAQREFNALWSFLGGILNQAKNYLPSWANNNIGLSTDTIKERIEKIDEEFDEETGSLAYRAGRVTIADGTTDIAVGFTSAFSDNDYVIEVTMENLVDAVPIMFSWIVVARSMNGFTVKLNAPTDTANYKLHYSCRKRS
jgi:hypothetical protein